MSSSSIDLNQMKGRTVLITGAGGFIGGHLTKALERFGVKVIATDRRTLDVTNEAQVKNAFQDPIDYVIHLAGQKSAQIAREKPAEALKASTNGTINLLEAARQQKHPVRKIILISSLSVYGLSEDQSQPKSLREIDPVRADSIYSATKITTEYVGLSYANDLKLPVTIARFANVYGPGQSEAAIIPSLISQMSSSKNISVGNTQPVRDFVYVEDVAEALMHLAVCEQSTGRAFNIGTGRGTSIQSLMMMISEIMNFKGQIVVEPSRIRQNEKSIIVAETSTMAAVTGWRAKTTLEEGLKKIIKEMK